MSLNKDLANYQRIINFDYPAFSENELKYLIGLLKFRADIMEIKLTDKQLSLQEEIPIFGTNNETLETRYEKGKNLSTQDEIQFYNDLILYDLMTQYMKISTILRNLLPIGEYFIVFSENNSPAIKSILKQKEELEHALVWLSFKSPSIENWEGLLGKILAINDDHLHLTLSNEQQVGQEPIIFSMNPKMYNRHIASIEQKIKHLKLVKEIMFGNSKKKALRVLERVESASRNQIDEMFNKYDGKPEELELDISMWLDHIEYVKIIFSNKALKNTEAWDKFFLRGIPQLTWD